MYLIKEKPRFVKNDMKYFCHVCNFYFFFEENYRIHTASHHHNVNFMMQQSNNKNQNKDHDEFIIEAEARLNELKKRYA